MTGKARFAISASAIALAAGAPAAAQDFYVGATLEYGNTTMTDIIPSTYDGDLTMMSVLAGVRFSTQSKLFFGAEVETSLFTDYNTDTFTGDEVDGISRLRAMVGYDFGSFSGFAAVGRANLRGLPAGSGLENGASGMTYGIGAEIPVSERVDLRLEAIRDDLEFENGSYSWDNTAVRVGAIVKF